MDTAVIGIAARALAVWLGLVVLASVNGILREALLVPALGERPGLLMSGILLSGLIFGVTWLCLPWLRAHGTRQLLAVGLGWLLLTVLFELSFGLLRGLPAREILAAYTFRDGNLWPLVLVVTAAAPWLTAKFRRQA